MDKFFAEILWIGISYILGSIPFGVLIAKSKGVNLREVGSGNIGATNVARSLGTKYGAITFLLDFFKGFIPVVIGSFISSSNLFIAIVGLACLLGHIYPIFLGFKGGKGIATTMGVFFAIAPSLTLIALVFSLFFIWLSGYVSLGSLIFVTLMPILFLVSFKFVFFLLGLVIFCLVYLRHKDNIIRLAKGIENPWKRSEFVQK